MCDQTTESADGRNITPRPPAGIPSHFPDTSRAVRAEFNLHVPHQGTAGAAPLKFLPVVNESVLVHQAPLRKYICSLNFLIFCFDGLVVPMPVTA